MCVQLPSLAADSRRAEVQGMSFSYGRIAQEKASLSACGGQVLTLCPARAGFPCLMSGRVSALTWEAGGPGVCLLPW